MGATTETEKGERLMGGFAPVHSLLLLIATVAMTAADLLLEGTLGDLASLADSSRDAAQILVGLGCFGRLFARGARPKSCERV